MNAEQALDVLPYAVLLFTPQRGVGGGEIVDLVIDYANPAATDAIGAPREALVGMPLHAVRPDFPDELYAAYLDVLRTGRPFRRVQTFGATGPDVTFEVTGVQVRDSLLVVFQDISSTAQSRVAAERYHALLDATPDWVGFADGQGRTLYLNPGGRRMVGLDPETDITGMPVGTWSPAWARDVIEREVLPVAHREGMWRGDLARVHTDGTEIPVNQVVIARRDEHGEVDFYATIARDVRREVAAAQALRESEERFRVAFEQAPIGIALLDLDGGFIQVNDAYCRTVRRPREDLLGRTVRDITHPDDIDLTDQALHRTATRTLGGGFEKRYLDPAGEVIWVEINAGVFHDTDGNPQYLIGQIQDVGERRAAHVLQRSMLTTQLPQLDGLDVAVRYLPAAMEAEVGGDWYDVIALPGGRVGIVVGDVVGRGVEAAGTMAQLRTALRAYAMEGLRPGEVVLRLHRLVDRLGDGLSTTLVFLDLDPGTGDLRYVSAGHLPPALRSPDGTTRLLQDGRSTPLGTAPLLPAPTEGRYVLAPGETVLLYTDGLVERRESPLDDRIEALRMAFASAPEDLDVLLDRMVELLTAGEQRHDDIALLALRAHEPDQAPLSVQLSAGAAELSAARARLREWLHEGQASDEDVTDILLATGEASANAVEHGTGPVELRARRHGRDVLLTIRDAGAWRPPQPSAQRGHGLRMMRLLMDAVQVVPTPEGTQVELRRTLGAPREGGLPPAPAQGGVVTGRSGDIPIATLTGEIDLGGAGALREALKAAVDPSDRGLVVDLGTVVYLDSAGLHLLHDLARTLTRQGQTLRVVAPTDPALRRVLELTGLQDIIAVDETVAGAVAGLTAR